MTNLQIHSRIIRRRGMTSVLAMIYLAVVAMLAVGFYTAIDMGANIADNEQYINRSATAAEDAMAFARFYLSPSQLSLPAGQTNLLSTMQTKLNAVLPNNYQASLGTNGSGVSTLYIPGSGGAPTWMSTDDLGGEAYIAVTNPGGGQTIQVTTVGKNSNSNGLNGSIVRLNQINFAGPPTLGYGLVSYGEILLSGSDVITGNGGVMAVTTGATKPIVVAGAGNSFSGGDFYWSNTTLPAAITWGSLQIDGFLYGTASFNKHIHANVTPPTYPSFDATSFASYAGSANPYGGSTYTTGTYSSNATTLTNCYLSGAGTYTFNNPLTINGVLYLGTGVKINFNKAVTLNGSIVEANAAHGAVGLTMNFSAVPTSLTQTSMAALPTSPNYPAGLKALSGTALLLPDYAVSCTGTVQTNDSIIGKSLSFNANVTVNSGSILNLGTPGVPSNLTFNGPATLHVTTSSNVPAGEDFQFTAAPSTYAEPQYTGALP